MDFLATLENRIGRVLQTIGEYLARWSDKTLLVALSVFYFVWRILTLPVFEFGGDAAWKWRILRYFYATGEWFPQFVEHHQGRWAQNLPVYWMMKLLQSDAGWVAAIIPVLTGWGVIVMVYLLSRRIAGKTAAVLSAFSVLCYPPFVQESAQFLPDLAAAFYILAGLYLISFYAEKPRWYLPLLTGLVMGLAWGCKVTAAYWVIGMGIYLVTLPQGGWALVRLKRFRLGGDALGLAAGFLAVFALESAFLVTHFAAPLGRLSFLLGHTGSNPNLYSYNVVQYLFSPVVFFLNFDGKMLNTVPQAMLFILTVVTLIGILWKPKGPPVQKLLVIAFLTAGFFHCYAVVKIFPFKHPERPLIRYFLPLASVAFILVYANLARFLLPCRNWRRVAVYAAIAVWIFMWSMMLPGAVNDALVNGDHLVSKCRVYRCMKLAKSKNLPVLVLYHRGNLFDARTKKVIILWRSLFAPAAELPAMATATAGSWTEAWEHEIPVVAESGEKYYLLSGRRPAAGETCECVEIDELTVKHKSMKFADRSEGQTESRE